MTSENITKERWDQLGLPPMELAETSENSRNNNGLYRCLLPSLQKLIVLTLLTVFGVGTYVLLLKISENYDNARNTEIIIVSGNSELPNVTVHNMEIFLQLKNTTFGQDPMADPKTKRKKRHTIPPTDSVEDPINLNDEQLEKAREIILNHDVICKNEEQQEICRDFVNKLKALTQNNDKIKTKEAETRVDSKNNHGAQHVDVDPKNKENDVAPTEISKREAYPMRNLDSILESAPSMPLEARDASPLTNPAILPHPHSMSPHLTDPCLLARLSKGIYDPTSEYSAPHYDHPLHTQSRYFSPSMHAPYLQERDINLQHPQDFDIFMSSLTSTSEPASVKTASNTSLETPCPEGMIQCSNGDSCIEEKAWCDGNVDCADVSDEARCSCKARVDKSRLCDGYFDCPFGEDEMGCYGCNDNKFSCGDLDMNSHSTCFSKEQRCNNVVDCPNHKDELECNMLAPSLVKKPLFAISNTEGFLHRNFKGNWYAVCKNPYMWAHDACRRETGLIIRPPFIQIVPIDPMSRIDYLNTVPGGLIQTSNTCMNSSAVYVTCPDLLCGTRVQSTTQLLRENAAIENRLFGRNKRFLSKNPYPLMYFRNRLKRNIDDTSSKTNYDMKFDTMKKNIFNTMRNKRTESRVVGGQPSQPAAWPWMVAVYRNGMFHCGGVVITHSWVVSAAHCVHKFWDYYYEVQVGMLRRFSFSPQEQSHRVTHVIVNRHYSQTDMKNDLSLLRVEPAIQFSRWVRPICLPSPDTAGPDWLWGPSPGTICTAVGWGATTEHGPDPDHMREVEVPIWDKCVHREDRDGKEICAGVVEGGKDACQGDSGGPLLCRNPLNSQQWYMAGIVSHGDGCGRKDEPGVYTRVSLFVKWIKYHITSKSLPAVQPKQDCPGFKCESGISKCLPIKRKCDKIVDCLNGEDETKCEFARTVSSADSKKLLQPKLPLEERVEIKETQTGSVTTSSSDEKQEDTTPVTLLSENVSSSSESDNEDDGVDSKERKSDSSDLKTFTPIKENSKPTHLKDESLDSTHGEDETPQSTREKDETPDSAHQKDKTSNSAHPKDQTPDSTNLQDETLYSTHRNDQAPDSSHEKNKKPNSMHRKDDRPDSTRQKDETLNSNNGNDEDLSHRKDETPDSMHRKDETADSNHGSDKILDSTLGKDKTPDSNHRKDDTPDSIHQKDETLDSTHGKEETPDSSHRKDKIPDSTHRKDNIPDFANASPLEISNDDNLENFSFSEETATSDPVSTTKREAFQSRGDEIMTVDISGESLESRSSVVNREKEATTESIGENDTFENDSNNNNFFDTNIETSTSVFTNSHIIEPIDDEATTPSIKNNSDENSRLHIKLLPNHQPNISDQETADSNPTNVEIEPNITSSHHKDLANKLTDFEEKGINNIDELLVSEFEPAKLRRKHRVPREFECQRIEQTIPYHYRCDRKADCEDGTDELDCTCTDFLSTFDEKLICDGVIDCADGQDESECFSCPENYFLCKRSQICLPEKHVCDGKPECPQGEDELNCYALTNGKDMEFDLDERPIVNLEGYLTKKHFQDWHVVCDDKLTIEQQEEAATHICRYLGFSSANRYNVKYINLKQDEIAERSVDNKRNRRDAMERVPIHFAYRQESEENDAARHAIIKEPQVIKEQCVPNITKTCKSLYVFCDNSLFTSFDDSKNMFLRETESVSNHTWPWIAKVFIEGDYRCTGVLVNLSWVLVSDSCLWDSTLSHHYITVVLGSHRTLESINGVHEQVYQVDAKKDVYRSKASLLHLKEPAHYSNVVKPMVVSSSYSLEQNSTCVAVGQDDKNNTISVFLEETSENCHPSNRCFKRKSNKNICPLEDKSHRHWAGIISCHTDQGWYPAATFVDGRGECGLGDRINATDIENLKNEIKHHYGKKVLPSLIDKDYGDGCEGVRCGRGRCVRMLQVCDGVRDCEDGYDESESACDNKTGMCKRDPYHRGCECSVGQMKCRNGKCVSKELFRDGNNDCGDGTDEPGQTTCSDYLARVMPSRLCDGIIHCHDRSDEDPMFCKCFAKRTYKCGTKFGVDHCVAPDTVCDGVRDCPNGEDEQTCIGLNAPHGTPYGTGQVIVRSYGVWHSKCYPSQNHTKSELEAICTELGYISGHAKQIKEMENFNVHPHNNLVLDPFNEITLNNNTVIRMRNAHEPIAKAVFDKELQDCYPLFIECR